MSNITSECVVVVILTGVAIATGIECDDANAQSEH
jgi:hypothetical protein